MPLTELRGDGYHLQVDVTGEIRGSTTVEHRLIEPLAWAPNERDGASVSQNNVTRIGFVLFSDLTQLDLTGPWEVLTRLPGAQCHLLAHDLGPVQSASGLSIVPTMTYQDCPQLDIVVVPGGPGHLAAMQDDALLDFLRKQEPNCRFMSAVCTGTLVLAAAGLLAGYRATTHWTSVHRLATFGVEPSDDRVVRDRNRFTGGGVTAGIDFGFRLLAELGGVKLAKEVQLQMQYAPEPPFEGSPAKAERAVVKTLVDRGAQYFRDVAPIDAEIAARFLDGA